MKNKISYIITFIFLSIGFAYTQAEPLFPSAQLEPQPMQSAQVTPPRPLTRVKRTPIKPPADPGK